MEQPGSPQSIGNKNKKNNYKHSPASPPPTKTLPGLPASPDIENVANKMESHVNSKPQIVLNSISYGNENIINKKASGSDSESSRSAEFVDLGNL